MLGLVSRQGNRVGGNNDHGQTVAITTARGGHLSRGGPHGLTVAGSLGSAGPVLWAVGTKGSP